LLVEDLALVGGSEQGFATAWGCPDRIGIEQGEQVDLLHWFNALDERKGCTQGKGSPPFDLDFYQLLCYRLKECFCEGFAASPPKPKIV
jgi:hypothetical protein